MCLPWLSGNCGSLVLYKTFKCQHKLERENTRTPITNSGSLLQTCQWIPELGTKTNKIKTLWQSQKQFHGIPIQIFPLKRTVYNTFSFSCRCSREVEALTVNQGGRSYLRGPQSDWWCHTSADWTLLLKTALSELIENENISWTSAIIQHDGFQVMRSVCCSLFPVKVGKPVREVKSQSLVLLWMRPLQQTSG